MLLAAPAGQSWSQLGYLGLAFVLSALIGLERELRQKSAGLRTLTVVGFASALFVLVSKYGFTDALGGAHAGRLRLDPSRVAAQIVTGLGFIGGGLIFVRRDAVKGLTTAAIVWLTAAVGMAAGAGLWAPAITATAAHFVVAYGFTPVVRRLSGRLRRTHSLRLVYRDGEGVLRRALALCTDAGFAVREVSTAPAGDDARDGSGPVRRRSMVVLSLEGEGGVTELAAALSELDGVLEAVAGDVGEETE